MKYLQLATAFLILWFGSASSEVTTNTLPPFKSLCISEEDVGFNWEGGKWTPSRFKPKKYILQKLDYEDSMKKVIYDQPRMCETPIARKVDESMDIATACYIVYEFGKSPLIFSDATTCYESFNKGKIDFIQCPKYGNFKPTGLFVKLPSAFSMDLSEKPYKDSMSLAVGTCSIL